MSGKIMGIAFDCDIPPTEKYVLVAMADHADHDGYGIHPTIELVAWKTGLSERTVQRAIRTLEGMGVLIRDSHGRGGVNKSGRGMATVYRVDPDTMPVRDRGKKGVNVTPYSRLKGDKSGGVRVTVTANSEPDTSEENRQEEPSTALAQAHENLDRRFDRFWAAYPRKTAKDVAYKSFLKLAPDDELLENMLAAIDDQRESRQWKDDKVIPHASSWINQKRWRDEVEQSRTVDQPAGDIFDRIDRGEV